MPDPIRRAHPRAIPLFIVLHFALTLLLNLVVFAGHFFRPLNDATGGVITGTLIANVLLILVLVVGVILRAGHLRAYDVGLIPGRLRAALAYTLLFWAITAGIHGVAGVLTHGRVTLHAVWNAPLIAFGALIAQLFGNVLFEEIAYRGFLFPQFYLRFERFAASRWLRFFAALGASQAVFALAHIPNRIYLGMTVEAIAVDLLLLVLWGTLYTLVYLRTDNLFLAIGVHTLGNAPLPLFATAPGLDGANASLMLYAVVLVVMFALPLVMNGVRGWGSKERGWGLGVGD